MAKSRRHPNMEIHALNFDSESWQLLELMSPNHKAIGSFLCRLVHCEYARRQERLAPRAVVAVGDKEAQHATP